MSGGKQNGRKTERRTRHSPAWQANDEICLAVYDSLLVGALYNIVDQIFIGWGVGYLGNGATNVVFPLTVLAWVWL